MKRFLNSSREDLLNAAGAALRVCKEIYGDDNCILITRLIDDDGQADIDIGYGVANFKPSPNSDVFYSRNMYDEYNKNVVGRVCIYGGKSFEIEPKSGSNTYFRELPNTFVIAPSIKKHIKDYIKL